MKKIMKTDYVEVRYNLDGIPLGRIMEQVASWIEYYGPDATLDIGADYDSAYVHIVYEREETDEECAQRVEDDKSRKTAQLERERAEFERLSKKFKGAV